VQIFFNDLINFAQELGVEDKRAIAQNLNEEELAIFGLLTKPEIQLTKQEEKRIIENAQTREVSFGLQEETANQSIGGSGD
jgi:type I restriction enzyme R subunit